MSQQPNRRTIVLGTLGAAAAASLFKNERFFQSKLSTRYIYACGSRSPKNLDGKSNTGVFTRIDLGNGSFKQIELPTKDLHSVIHVGEKLAVTSNYRAAFLLNENLEVEKSFDCGPKLAIGGHAVYIKEHKSILIGVKASKESGKSQVGKLWILDASTFRKTGEIASGGFDPHDMQWLSENQFGVCNYGDEFPNDLLEYRNLQPSISVFDAKSLNLLGNIKVPNMGSVSHIAAIDQNRFAAINALLFPLVDYNIPVVKNLLGGVDFEISAPEHEETRIAAASNLFLYDKNKLVESVLSEPIHQRRAQSICFHKSSNSIFVTYSYSNYLGCYRDGKLKLISGKDLGIETLRGVLAVEDSIFVNGQNNDILELDVRTLKTKRKISVPLFNSTHIFA